MRPRVVSISARHRNGPGPAVRCRHMRKLTFVVFGLSAVVVLISLTSRARAEHGSPLLLVKPGSGSAIPRNARIRLVSYNGEDGLIQWLGRSPRKVRIRLESERGAVRLHPVRYVTDHDGYGRAMVSLAARGLLAPFTEYRLVVDVPSEGLNGELATFTTTDRIDRAPPRWRSRPDYDAADRTFRGRIAEREGLVEVGITVWPRGKGRARRTFVLFDLEQQCIEGPTVDYNVVIYNSQCVDSEERAREGAVCDTLYYFPPWRPEGTLYDVTIDLRDLAGNLRRIRRPAARIEIGEPFGLCLEM